MGDQTIAITDQNMDAEVLKADVPVLIDFWAEWCGPCLAIGPTIEKIAEEYTGKAKVCKVNVDVSPQIAAQYGVRSIPTLLFFKGGQVQEQMVGAVNKEQITQALDKLN